MNQIKKSLSNCSGCENLISGSYITALGYDWHPLCFTCRGCGKTIKDESFSEHQGEPYHTECYRQQFNPKCTICGDIICGSYSINFWDEPYCNCHKNELPNCYSCGRLISQKLTKGGVEYPDGRTVCNCCSCRAINEIDIGQKVLTHVQQELSKIGLETFSPKIKFRLTDQQEIQQLSTQDYSQKPSGLTRKEIITRNGEVVERRIEEVLALYGLPYDNLATIIAHELGHVWLFINNFPKLPPKVEEGLCELFAFLWLSNQNTPESAYHLKLLHHNSDPIYGEGFQEAYKALNSYSLFNLFAYVKQYQSFPNEID